MIELYSFIYFSVYVVRYWYECEIWWPAVINKLLIKSLFYDHNIKTKETKTEMCRCAVRSAVLTFKMKDHWEYRHKKKVISHHHFLRQLWKTPSWFYSHLDYWVHMLYSPHTKISPLAAWKLWLMLRCFSLFSDHDLTFLTNHSVIVGCL